MIRRYYDKIPQGLYTMATIATIMKTTTIQLSTETKTLISTFGTKEDTYEDILKRMYQLAVKEQLREFLLSSEDTISIDRAIIKAKKKWQK
jgi:hypothetical protein